MEKEKFDEQDIEYVGENAVKKYLENYKNLEKI